MSQQPQQQNQTQTQRQLRIALAEIPNSFDVMNLVNTPQNNNHNHDDDRRMRNGIWTTATTPTTHFDHTTNVAIQMLSETSLSPEEIVLRQRGRRRSTANTTTTTTTTTLTNNNKTKNCAMPFQRTPTKILTTSMILRSSPRKRLSMGTLPPITPTKKEEAQRQQQQQQNDKYNSDALLLEEPVRKKARIAFKNNNNNEVIRPLVQKNNDLPLEQLLSAMSSQQLIKLIVDNWVAGNKEMEIKLRQNLPMADISLLEQELNRAKNNIFKSLPTSRLYAKTDSCSYSRAVTHLNEFKRLISAHTKQLNDAGHWDALFDYVHMAWKATRSTPLWECYTQNSVRRQCFTLLSKYCAIALNNGNMALGAMRLEKMERNIKMWLNDNDNAIICQQVLEKLLTKVRHSV